MRLLLLAVFVFRFSCPASSQNTDSFSRAVDSSAKQIQQSYEALEDSLYRLQMQRDINEKGQELDEFLAGYKEGQKKEKQQTYIRIGLGVAFVAALIYGLARRRKQRRNSA